MVLDRLVGGIFLIMCSHHKGGYGEGTISEGVG